MASNSRTTAAAITAAAAAISSADPRYPAPEQGRWKGYWTRYWCFGSQKREKRIAPSSRGDGATSSAWGWTAAGPGQAALALAPPSSPASFVNSSVQSPASFTLSLSVASASMCSPGPINTMFVIGPYAHETQLVSPPVFSSTITTEPSTAPFTPPPELAHLTTPSSPDVPFAQLVASSLEAKSAARGGVSPLCTSDRPAHYVPPSYHLDPGSPVGHLISTTSGYVDRETTLAVPDIDFPFQSSSSIGELVPSFHIFEPCNPSIFNGESCAAFISTRASISDFQQAADGMLGSGRNLDLTSSAMIERGTAVNTLPDCIDMYRLSNDVCQCDAETLVTVNEDEQNAEQLGGSSVYGSGKCADVKNGYRDASDSMKGYDFNGPASRMRMQTCGGVVELKHELVHLSRLR